MKLAAIPAMEKNLESFISERFARAPYFYLYNVEERTGEWIESGINDAHGAGTKAVQKLAESGIDCAFGVNIGENAAEALSAAGIESITVDKTALIRTIIEGLN